MTDKMILNSEDREQLRDSILKSVNSIKGVLDDASNKVHTDINNLTFLTIVRFM